MKIRKYLLSLFLLLVEIIGSFCFLIGVLLHFASRWMLEYWPDLKIEELIYQLNQPMEGTSTEVYASFAKAAGLPGLAALLVLLILFLLFRKRKWICLLLSVLAALAGAYAGYEAYHYVWDALDVTAYLENQTEMSQVIDPEYVNPKACKLTFPEQKRNLIYIFLESMETTYTDAEHEGAMEYNAIPELVDLAANHINFSNTDSFGGAFATTGATWTMGGIFAQTAGLPLKITADNNDMAYQTSFFPDLTCLGDILSEQGYHQVFMIGSDATFGGRANYFAEHGGAEQLDYYWAIGQHYISSDYYKWWGYEDQKLIEYAKKELLQLAAEDAPFNFTMLTVDTHCQRGYVCEQCGDEFEHQYGNVIACSSRQISEFVSWIQEQDFYDNTTIVLAGDHLTMDTDYWKHMKEGYSRRTYNCFINAAAVPSREKNRIFTTLDLFPSTLAAMGVEIEGNRLGLGTNLFSEEDTLAEIYGLSELNQELGKQSVLFEHMNQDIEQIWQKDEHGKKYYIAEESRFAQNEWIDYDPKRGRNLEPERYYFDENGYAYTGWHWMDNRWYYFKSNGLYVENPTEDPPKTRAERVRDLMEGTERTLFAR